MDSGGIATTAWEQITTVIAVPIPFFAAILFVGWLIWLFVRREYSTRLENAASNLELANARLADYERKLAGASPDEAKARIDNLEAKLEHLMPRRVSAEQRERIRQALRGTTGTISIGSDMACADAPAFNSGLTAAFRNAGWETMNPSFMGLANPPASGVGVRCLDCHNPTLKEVSVMNALTEARIEFDVQPGRDLERVNGRQEIEAEIVITPRVMD
ncbi:hypothetical protein M2333_001693 [Sphingobium sp. B11D3B]|uniref:hypothetical protein n=1 Tax=Sphingobium sp. B11D3B TaxID=2940575 RepID=UPI002227EFF4|nr:hypothetical protein [Sphingobium sp. B11D3B]MCW2388647.1 hypothetical protein [Sphingobium sp. B11D3B]